MTEHLYGGTRGVTAAPQHVHGDDGTVEGCPGCFPPAESIRRADVHDHEEFRDGTVAGCPACRLDYDDYGGIPAILRVIELVDAHLDDAAPAVYRTDPAASAELNEARALANRWRRIAGGPGCEVHEATEELLAVTGGNPRKGVHGSEADMLSELGDTACAALLAIQSQTKDTAKTWQLFLAALAKAESRVPADPSPEAGTNWLTQEFRNSRQEYEALPDNARPVIAAPADLEEPGPGYWEVGDYG
jgi:hypothetical protein